jgi:hypothetical protein
MTRLKAWKALALPFTGISDPDHRRPARRVRFSEEPYRERALENPSLLSAVGKLALAGGQAGFSLEQMIGLLDAGLGVDSLVDLISWRLERVVSPPAPPAQPSGWLV